jgi:5-formyltetrahydrofolate cyclo-ligase
MTQPPPWRLEKQRLRAEVHARRPKQPDKDRLSRLICAKFAALGEYADAATVMFYMHARSEVRTQPLLTTALDGDKRIVVPYCAGDRLELFWLRAMEELAPGAFGILEPKTELRDRSERKVEAAQLDLVMVPGVAFDAGGGRVGHGRGYYDRFLRHVRPDVLLVALAFECQMFPRVPVQPHDVTMHKIITEKTVYHIKPSAPL